MFKLKIAFFPLKNAVCKQFIFNCDVTMTPSTSFRSSSWCCISNDAKSRVCISNSFGIVKLKNRSSTKSFVALSVIVKFIKLCFENDVVDIS